MIEVQGPHGVFTISEISELCNLSKMSCSSSPVTRSEDVNRKSDGEDVKWLTWMAPRITETGKDTGGRTSMPETQQKMKIDKLDKQQQERSRSLPRRTSYKSAKT
jgi:hypothetical protein